MIGPRYIHFAYHTNYHKDRGCDPFRMRDAHAAQWIGSALMEHGYRFGGVEFNYPHPLPYPTENGEVVRSKLIPRDRGRYKPHDLILLTTRPPTHDHTTNDRKSIPRSFTTLENDIFEDLVSQWIERSSRAEMHLSNAAASISPEVAKRQHMLFRQNCGASFQAFKPAADREWLEFRQTHFTTAAFLMYAEHAWPGGPKFLAAFGMSGTDTLGWCYLLATKYPHLLCSTRFALVEMTTAPYTEPPTEEFADSWDVRILGAE